MCSSEYKVSSEIYGEYDYTSSSKPYVDQNNIVSRFVFAVTPASHRLDSDGDIEVVRKKNVEKCIEIEHSNCTVLNLVGLQIWRGAFLLSDWLIFNSSKLANTTILELGAGVGLTSIVASMYAPVITTDVNRGNLFKIIESNYIRNKHLTKCNLNILELDFMQDKLPDSIINVLPNVSLIIAADVVYDNHLTEAFVNTVEKILKLPPKKTVIIALEKRYVFTIEDCDTVAPCYDYFLECLDKLKNVTINEVECNFPKYFQYDRIKQLVLWEIVSTLK